MPRLWVTITISIRLLVSFLLGTLSDDLHTFTKLEYEGRLSMVTEEKIRRNGNSNNNKISIVVIHQVYIVICYHLMEERYHQQMVLVMHLVHNYLVRRIYKSNINNIIIIIISITITLLLGLILYSSIEEVIYVPVPILMLVDVMHL